MKKNILKKISLILIFSFITLYSHSQSNQYLHFDGEDDYTELPNGSQYLNGSNTITMSGWFYTDQLTYGQGMMSIRGGGTGDGQMYVIQLDNGILECRVITSTGQHEFVAPAGTIQAGTWQHIAWIFNENTVELFVDGILIGSNSASGTFQSADRPFSIGKCIQPGLNFLFKGRADEVSLWTKALTQTEIQDLMSNELNGDEENLEVYYKFNQGTPGGNNTNISQLLAEGNSPSKNSNLVNFSLTGENSNFGGELESGFQVISFYPITNKLTTDEPFQLEASSNSGLPISFEVVSGPATVEGDVLSLTGESGEVTVKAMQDGNENFEPAEEVFVTFEVLDPSEVLVETEILHPLGDEVYVPNLIPLKVAIKAEIDYPELFNVNDVFVEIEGNEIELTDYENGYYVGWWTPSGYGNFDIVLTASNNFGAQETTTSTITVLEDNNNVITLATDEVWVSADYPSQTVETVLPSHVGAFDEITGTLYIDCPNGGCDPWDRISSIEAQGKDGKWYEIIRYLTPYGVSCQSEIDLTDFSSILQGKTKFRVNLGTQGNGFLYTLELNYHAGVPEYPYSRVKKLWDQTYQFGDPANLQPTEEINVNFSPNTEDAKIKLVSTGHGWGENNTGNAAEFQENTHHIWVNNNETFEQNNWNDCNPNPDNCSPQFGTWQYDRAGWCPGTIAQFFDYNMSEFTEQNSVSLKYIFDESYVDYCHPNNPDCVSGSTCPNCDDGFNPHLIVSSYLISFSNSPLNALEVKSFPKEKFDVNIYPNPSGGKFYVDLKNYDVDEFVVYNYSGKIVKHKSNNSRDKTIFFDLSNQSAGVYLISAYKSGKIIDTKRVIIE